MHLNCKNPEYPSQFTKVKQKILIKIVSAQYLRHEIETDVKNVINPFVEVFLKGSNIDEQKNIKYKTKVISIIKLV